MQDTLLPAGNLREPLAALVEADVVVLREEEADSLRSVVAGLSGGREEERSGWSCPATLSLGEGGEVALPSKPFAFCGVARPENFTWMLAAQGYEPMDTMVFSLTTTAMTRTICTDCWNARARC